MILILTYIFHLVLYILERTIRRRGFLISFCYYLQRLKPLYDIKWLCLKSVSSVISSDYMFIDFSVNLTFPDNKRYSKIFISFNCFDIQWCKWYLLTKCHLCNSYIIVSVSSITQGTKQTRNVFFSSYRVCQIHIMTFFLFLFFHPSVCLSGIWFFLVMHP